jgi:hypothetical protein
VAHVGVGEVGRMDHPVEPGPQFFQGVEGTHARTTPFQPPS